MESIRILNLSELLRKKSLFLFGPRGTGKTSLIRKQLKGRATVIDLLQGNIALRLTANPSDLEAMIDADGAPSRELVVIDEIQRVPELLNEVHRLIEERKTHFLLTGSSARKLKAGQANLLAGRAWQAELYPLIYPEILDFNLDRRLQYGGLPAVYFSADPQEDLFAYVNTYLKEEIQAEGFVRKLPQFSRFLVTSAMMNGQVLNFTKASNDTSVPASTIREYYHILEDTLLGFFVEPWVKSKKRKSVSTAKFYLFDSGVTNTICEIRTLDRNSDIYGRCFESFLATELKAYISYKRLHLPLCFWRTTTQQEVDFVVGEELAVEAKASGHVSPRDLKGLKALAEERIVKKLYLVSLDTIETSRDGISVVHWKRFLEMLWGGDIL